MLPRLKGGVARQRYGDTERAERLIDVATLAVGAHGAEERTSARFIPNRNWLLLRSSSQPNAASVVSTISRRGLQSRRHMGSALPRATPDGTKGARAPRPGVAVTATSPARSDIRLQRSFVRVVMQDASHFSQTHDSQVWSSSGALTQSASKRSLPTR